MKFCSYGGGHSSRERKRKIRVTQSKPETLQAISFQAKSLCRLKKRKRKIVFHLGVCVCACVCFLTILICFSPVVGKILLFTKQCLNGKECALCFQPLEPAFKSHTHTQSKEGILEHMLPFILFHPLPRFQTNEL